MAKFKREYGEVILVVEGKGTFPIDMLRYDAAAPFGEDESSRITRADTDNVTMERRVVLRMFAVSSTQKPGTRRWASFGWTVVWYGSRDAFNIERHKLLEGRSR